MFRESKLKLVMLAVILILGLALFVEVRALQEASVSTSATVIPAKDRAITTLQDLNQAFVDIAKSVTPTVVTVSTEQTVKMRDVNPFSDFFGSPFGDLFGGGDQGQGKAPEREFKQRGLGSGVIVSGEGYIITNNHVVQGADTISVRTSDGRTFIAKVIGTDPKTDIAVIRVDASGLPAIQKGNSDNLQVGEMVMAIGSPLSPSLAHTVTQGIVSATGRSNVGLAEYEDFIQTDAAINPGNSGGALVNMNGQLVGINSAIVSQSGGFQGIGLAVPVNMAMRVMEALIKNGKVIRGWLGVSIQDLNDNITRAMHLSGNEGALVGEIVPESPAAKAGLEAGDVIVRMDGKTVVNSTQFRNDIAASAPGTSVSLSVVRKGKTMDFNVRLGELPATTPTPRAVTQELTDLLRFKVETLTRELASKYGIDPKLSGVVVTAIDPHSEAYGAGLQEGDLIRTVNNMKVANEADFDGALKDAKQGDTVLMQVVRQGGGFFLAFTL